MWSVQQRQRTRIQARARPAGGSFSAGTGGEEITLDAVEFCRVLSGRAAGTGLMAHEVPF